MNKSSQPNATEAWPSSEQREYAKLSGVLISIAIGLVLFGVLSSVTWFWVPERTFYLLYSGSYTLIPAALLITFALLRLWTRRIPLRSLVLSPWAFAWCLVLVFLSDWLCARYSLFRAPAIRGELLLGMFCTWLLLRFRRERLLISLVPIATIALLLSVFLIQTSGRQIYSDDHSTFFYRLVLLKEQFPVIPFYYPFWNGGLDARDFLATGVLNIFFLAAPLIYAFPVEQVYNFIVASLLFLFLPAMILWASRLARLSWAAAGTAATLALCSSFTWYKWALSYGTLGFATTVAILPVVLAFSSLILAQAKQLTRLQAILLVIVITLMLFWSLSGIVFIPLMLAALILLPRLLKQRYLPTILLSLIAINLPWILLFWSASQVSSFLVSEDPPISVEAETSQQGATTVDGNLWETEERVFRKPSYKHKAGGLDIRKSLSITREQGHSANPLVLFLAIPGLLLLQKGTRRYYVLTYIWLLFLGSVCVPFKPQLELDRMLVILVMCLTIPAGAALVELLNNTKTWKQLIPATVAGGFLMVGPLSTAAIVNNRGLMRYTFVDQRLTELVDVINTEVQTGRAFFAGCVVHELNGGHLAPLAYFTQRPLIASSHVHNIWRYTRALPYEFLVRKLEGHLEYFNLYNVTHILVFENGIRNFYQSHPEHFELVWEAPFRWNGQPLHMYRRRNYDPTYFLQGDGEIVAQHTNSVTVKLFTPQAVLKFNYFPFLTADGCQIKPFEVTQGISLIKLSSCPTGQAITIKSTPPLARIGK